MGFVEACGGVEVPSSEGSVPRWVGRLWGLEDPFYLCVDKMLGPHPQPFLGLARGTRFSLVTGPVRTAPRFLKDFSVPRSPGGGH